MHDDDKALNLAINETKAFALSVKITEISVISGKVWVFSG
jgi:hypothetical protein